MIFKTPEYAAGSRTNLTCKRRTGEGSIRILGIVTGNHAVFAVILNVADIASINVQLCFIVKRKHIVTGAAAGVFVLGLTALVEPLQIHLVKEVGFLLGARGCSVDRINLLRNGCG